MYPALADGRIPKGIGPIDRSSGSPEPETEFPVGAVFKPRLPGGSCRPRALACPETVVRDRPIPNGKIPKDRSSGSPDPERQDRAILTYRVGPTSYRRARACPSPGHDRGGQAPALRFPSPSVVRDRPIPNGSRSGDLDLQSRAQLFIPKIPKILLKNKI